MIRAYLRATFLSLSLGFLGMAGAFAQSLKAYEKSADEAFANGDYYNAVNFYEIVLKSKPKPGLYYKYAEAARLSYSYAKAEEAYREVLKSNESKAFPKLKYHFGLALKHNGKYEEAERAFDEFLKGYSENDFTKQKATQEWKSCEIARKLVNTPIDSVYIQGLPQGLNTQYSDVGASRSNGSFYYTSLSFESEPIDPKNKKQKDQPKKLVAKILSSPNDQTAGEIVAALNTADQHSAHTAVSATGQRLFFNRCTGGAGNDTIRCQIWMVEWKDGAWTNPQPAPKPLNDAGNTNTQPHVVYEPEVNKTWIYWVSDRPGGVGGLDIWGAEIRRDTPRLVLSDAFVLRAPVNSPDDEATPFYDTKTQTLYFSSLWHAGLGGYDVFKARKIAANVWDKPENIGVPYNSAANDLYFVKNSDDTKGYLASNRSGSQQITGEACCNDIYRFGFKTSKPTPLTKIDTNTLVKVDTPKTKVDTPVVKIDTPKVDTPIAKVDTPKTKVDTPVVKIDTPKVDTPIAKVDTPKNTPDIAKKLEELNSMLPLTLYFHNDEPDSNTTARSTDKPYEIPYRDYIGMRDIYKQAHASQFAPETQPLIFKKIDDFFVNDVEGEYNRMNRFYDQVLELLESGVKLEISIKGYTSPRSNEQYNEYLAQRRITSVRKQLFIYRGGIFLRHFQSGHFTVREIPLGESTSPKNVPDALEDPLNSIYSVEASRERRAEIIVIQKK